mmetsp:Transcript_62908/g.99868  ORF Transcript_62908/g.99868 Transcript_62908/m.99868 type:complete len:233 (-) Transcript_62908:487-1185(-)
MDVNLSVRFPRRECRTESANLSATSAATFLDIRDVLKLFKIGAKSSSVISAPPVRFFTLFVSDLKRPPTRPAFPSSCFSSSSFSLSASIEDTSSGIGSSSALGRNCSLNIPMSSSFSAPFVAERSRLSIIFAVTFVWPSQLRASFPFFLPFSSVGFASAVFFDFGTNLPGPFFLAVSPAESSPAELPALSSSSSSASSPLAPPPFFFFCSLPTSSFPSKIFFPLSVSANDFI